MKFDAMASHDNQI